MVGHKRSGGWRVAFPAPTLGPAIVFSIGALVFSAAVLLGQNPCANTAEGQALFGKNCAGCHGADALGSDRGPALAGNRDLSDRSLRSLHELIKLGIPGTGMPAFDLPDKDLEALAEFVHSLNWQAAGTSVPGDPAAGEKYFFGNGKCSSCHMVSSRGSAVGPNLSNLGNEKTLEEIRAALLSPMRM